MKIKREEKERKSEKREKAGGRTVGGGELVGRKAGWGWGQGRRKKSQLHPEVSGEPGADTNRHWSTGQTLRDQP